MKSVDGLVVKDGHSFTLDIEEQASAKQMIKVKMQFHFPADQMPHSQEGRQLAQDKRPRREATEGEGREDDVHLLVNFPDIVVPEKKIWIAEELATVHPRVQLDVWKSVVRVSVLVSSKVVTTATSLVVERDDTHFYLMTNLSLWADKRFAVGLSAGFKKDINRFLGRRFETSASHNPEQQHEAERPQVMIERLSPEGAAMDGVHEFSREDDVCWRSSATLEFAILKVVVPEHVQLVRYKMASFDVVPTTEVHVFLFRTIPFHFGPPYAIVPAQITGKMWNEINLSVHGLPEGAIACTNNGIAVGYIVSGGDYEVPVVRFHSPGDAKGFIARIVRDEAKL